MRYGIIGSVVRCETFAESERMKFDTNKTKEERMKKIVSIVFSVIIAISTLVVSAFATTEYTVVRGDTMWRIAKRHEVGVDEIAAANPHIKNPNLIYPGDKLSIPGTDSEVLKFEREVIRLVNVERESRGLSPLTYNWELSRVARFKSQDMSDNGYFSHTSPTYGSPFDMIKSFGIAYRSAGENIAKGYSTPKAVVDGWMNSSGHRANILNEQFKEIGVGYVADGRYWTQMFIRP